MWAFAMLIRRTRSVFGLKAMRSPLALTKASRPSHTAPLATAKPLTALRAGSRRQDPVRGLSAAAVGAATPPVWPPKISSSLPVQTDAYPSLTPRGPLARRRQVLVRGLYTAPPAGPSGEFPAHTTSSRFLPVQPDAYPSLTPRGPLARRRQVLVRGLYTAPPAGPSGEFPAQTTISRPVHAEPVPPPPRTPDGGLAILCHLRVAGLYAAPSESARGSR